MNNLNINYYLSKNGYLVIKKLCQSKKMYFIYEKKEKNYVENIV